jgi:hypothetical protein
LNFQLNENLITTQNDAEAWHHRMHVIINSEHIGVFKLIQELQKEVKSTAVDILDMCTKKDKLQPKTPANSVG